ncbi:Conserved_hypothetical protein [Hexamita inflata]|uniref:F-actin-capping protein subunit beta n=1 Tax=Hexamita inflata TaxID=28002 RepID=A0AA86NW57_9EUKA|nr:Conserved hypothetical protein [Hexamita inflata]
MQAAFQLLNRLPPSRTYEFIDMLSIEDPSFDQLKSQFDECFQVQRDEQSKQDFICSPFNQEGDVFRSPYTNLLTNSQQSAYPLSAHKLEIQQYANQCLLTYAHQYFGNNAISNCYVWEETDQLFMAAVLVKAVNWTSTHVFSFSLQTENNWAVHIDSSVLLQFQKESKAKIDGSKRWTKDFTIKAETPKEFVFKGIAMVEEIETQILGTIGDVYFGNCVEAARKVCGVQMDVSVR